MNESATPLSEKLSSTCSRVQTFVIAFFFCQKSFFVSPSPQTLIISIFKVTFWQCFHSFQSVFSFKYKNYFDFNLFLKLDWKRSKREKIFIFYKFIKFRRFLFVVFFHRDKNCCDKGRICHWKFTHFFIPTCIQLLFVIRIDPKGPILSVIYKTFNVTG